MDIIDSSASASPQYGAGSNRTGAPLLFSTAQLPLHKSPCSSDGAIGSLDNIAGTRFNASSLHRTRGVRHTTHVSTHRSGWSERGVCGDAHQYPRAWKSVSLGK